MLQLGVNSLMETRQLAGRLAGIIEDYPDGLDIALIGELGTGKTTLVRFLAQALQVEEPVSSPSFVLQHEYHCAGGRILEHWDLYRLRRLPDELVEPPALNSVRVVEWADRVASFVESCKLTIKLSFMGGDPTSSRRLVAIDGARYLTCDLGEKLKKESKRGAGS